MVESDVQEGRYRVLLIGVGNNTEEEKESFCCNISKSYHVPSPQLKKIIDRCPIILKKNLPLRKAKQLAKTFRSFGASVSVEGRRQILPISLEFQELVPHRLALESSLLRKSQRATWSVTGRAKNISDQTLNDVWVLIQLFEDFEEFMAFEETPLPINPLPSGQCSPFKVIFEGDLSFKKISIAFKNASGEPIPAGDRRKKKEWLRIDVEEQGFLRPPPRMSTVDEEDSLVVGMIRDPGKAEAEKEEGIPSDVYTLSEQEVVSPDGEETRGDREKEQVPGEAHSLSVEPLGKIIESTLALLKEESNQEEEVLEKVIEREGPPELASSFVSEEQEKESETTLGESALPSDEQRGAEKSCPETSAFQETVPSPEEISGISENGKREVTGKAVPSFYWIGHFREAVDAFYQTHPDIFSVWFEECRKNNEFKDSLHKLLTLLVHCRFDQGSQSLNALENTRKVFQLVVQPNLSTDQIPPLQGTSFASAEIWGDLFQRALSKIRQIASRILEKRGWKAMELERLIQVIPQVGHQNSRIATRWIDELIPDVLEVDFSDTPITVQEGLYRVAARLGIVNPQADFYQGGNSVGEVKIRSFAIAAFPDKPVKVEKPMEWIGDEVERGGHCFPVRPRCEGCLFDPFCPKFYLDFNPSEKGMSAEE